MRSVGLVSERRVQEFSVRRRGGASAGPGAGHFYKFCLNLPKGTVRDMGLYNGQVMYLERSGSRCTMRTARRSEGDCEVRLNELATRRRNGNTYTVTRFVFPKGLALCLGISKGDIVSIYESRDGIRLDFGPANPPKSCNYEPTHITCSFLPVFFLKFL